MGVYGYLGLRHMAGSGTWNAGDRADTFGAAGWSQVVGKWN